SIRHTGHAQTAHLIGCSPATGEGKQRTDVGGLSLLRSTQIYSRPDSTKTHKEVHRLRHGHVASRPGVGVHRHALALAPGHRAERMLGEPLEEVCRVPA